MRWDPQRYLEFAAERGRPFADLVARIGTDNPRLVVDLGCGPGNLTRTLVDRWPGARIHGVDSSTEMIERAVSESDAAVSTNSEGSTGRLTFEVADLRTWAPPEPVDVIVCNATLQWVPDHLDLLPRLVEGVRRGGWLAFQVPGNFGDRSHTAMSELVRSNRWSAAFEGRDRARAAVEEPATYLETLAGLGCTADVWETTYLHVLQGPDAVVRWVMGTGLRPYLQALEADADRQEFLADYRALVAPAYPERPWGTVLPFRRIFAVAQRGAA
jgi:trans-aconitate 2-methyltransferase